MKSAVLSHSILCLLGAVALFPAAAMADTPAWEFSTLVNQSTNGDWTFGEVLPRTRTSPLTFWATTTLQPG